MSIVIDSVSISGMRKADFEQLEEIFNYFERQGVYWGRRDYFDDRQIRIGIWIRGINMLLEHHDTRIKK